MFKSLILRSLQKASGEKSVDIQTPELGEQGDYSSNIAMQLFSQFPISNFQFPIKDIKNPRQLAEKIVEKLNEDKDLKKIVDKVEVAGPGFLNFWLKKEVLVSELNNVLSEAEKYGSSNLGKGKTVVIDYSSPNIAKRFSIGHLRSTIIGQALYNLYTALGAKVVGDNHLGDWGTQFGVLIYMVEKNKLDPKKLSIEEWEKLYVDFHTALDKNPDLKNESRNAFMRLEKGDKKAKEIWQIALETSLKEYQKLYDLLNVKIDYAFGESFYEDKMPEAIELAKKKGIVKKSGDAWVVEFPKYKLPSNILVKSNGTTTYLARDLAVMFFRKEKWSPDLQIFE